MISPSLSPLHQMGKNDKIDTTINDVLRAHKDKYVLVVSDGSVRQTHQMNFGWVLSTVGGLYLAKSCGGCDGRGSSLRAEAVGMLTISIFIALTTKHSKQTDTKSTYVYDTQQLINTSRKYSNCKCSAASIEWGEYRATVSPLKQ